MLKKVLAPFLTILVALGVLSLSIFRSASPVSYAFSLPATPEPQSFDQGEMEKVKIDYILPYPGKILPDSSFWFLKAIRDKVWYGITTNLGKKAQLNLLFADKRLVSARMLFENGKPELAFETLEKSEMYLEEALSMETKARGRGDDTTEFLITLSKSALKHMEEISSILSLAPADAKPEIIKVMDQPKEIYEATVHLLQEKGVTPPTNPFDGKI